MEFRQLEAFVNAVKYKSFSKAADATFLSQPTISTHIINLEAELGVRLLNRKGREISLTAEGQEFFGYAIELLNTRDHAVNQIRQDKRTLEGIVEIQTSSIPAHVLLPEWMVMFRRLHPKIRFYVEQTDSRTVNDNLLNQHGELGFTGYKGTSALSYETLFQDEMVLITPNTETYQMYENGDEISADHFLQEPFVLREDGSGTKQEMEEALIDGKTIFKHVDIVAKMTSLSAVIEAVGRDLGVSIVSERAVKEYAKNGQIRYFRIKGLEKKRTFYLTYNPSATLSPQADAFLKFVRERLQEQ